MDNFGKTVQLSLPYRGYRTGKLTGGYIDYRYEVELSSGLTIWLFEDEFTEAA